MVRTLARRGPGGRRLSDGANRAWIPYRRSIEDHLGRNRERGGRRDSPRLHQAGAAAVADEAWVDHPHSGSDGRRRLSRWRTNGGAGGASRYPGGHRRIGGEPVRSGCGDAFRATPSARCEAGSHPRMKKGGGATPPPPPSRVTVSGAYRGCLSTAKMKVGFVNALVCGARLLATDRGISIADITVSGIVLPPIGSRFADGSPAAP